MPPVMPHMYVVRPRPELLERVPADAWFARPHVWCLPSVGDHDFAGQQRLAESRLKLAFLAEIHADTTRESGSASPFLIELARRDREVARALTDWMPLTLATFDRLFELEAVGVGYRSYDTKRIPESSVRAVLPSSENDLVAETAWGPFSLRERWTSMIEHRLEGEAAAIAGLRYLVPRLFEAFADLVTPPECDVRAMHHALPNGMMRTLLEQDGWRLDTRAPLSLRLVCVDGPLIDGATFVRLECECVVNEPRGSSARRGRPLVTSKVFARVQQDGAAWNVVEASMDIEHTTKVTRSLLP